MAMTLLGTITVPGTTAKNNSTTAVPFTIPYSCPRVSIVLPTGALGFNVAVDTVNTVDATSNGLLQNGNQNIQLPMKLGTGLQNYISIYNLNAGSVNVLVYSLDGQVS